jgi:hypothetical protein
MAISSPSLSPVPGRVDTPFTIIATKSFLSCPQIPLSKAPPYISISFSRRSLTVEPSFSSTSTLPLREGSKLWKNLTLTFMKISLIIDI